MRFAGGLLSEVAVTPSEDNNVYYLGIANSRNPRHLDAIEGGRVS